jgi:hypothetical protein
MGFVHPLVEPLTIHVVQNFFVPRFLPSGEKIAPDEQNAA